jgi:hypothetical protein
LHFSCTNHQCTTVLRVVRKGPSSMLPLYPPSKPLTGQQLRTASRAMRFESNARSGHELMYTALSPLWIMEIAYLDQGGVSKGETLLQFLEFNILKPSGFFTYHQAKRSNILHGTRLELSILYGFQIRQRPFLYTSLTDWSL